MRSYSAQDYLPDAVRANARATDPTRWPWCRGPHLNESRKAAPATHRGGSCWLSDSKNVIFTKPPGLVPLFARDGFRRCGIRAPTL